MARVLHELWHAWSREPAGALLTLLGVVLGSASLVFLASGLHGARIALAHTSQQASGNDIVRIIPDTAPAGAPDYAPLLSRRDADALREKERLGADAVASGLTLHEREASAGSKTMPVGVQSGGAAWMRLTGVELQHGRPLHPAEDGLRVCVLGYDVWQRLFGGQWPLENSSVLLDGGTKLTVIGVLQRRPPMGGGSGGETWRVDRKIFVSQATLERAVQAGPHASAIAMRYERVDPPIEPRAASLRLLPYVRALHWGVNNFRFDALGEGLALDKLVTTALTAVLLVGGMVAIAVGGINVMNSQLVTVAERTREFAIRRALGLSAARLRRNVLLESVAMTCTGALAGCLLGLLMAWGLAEILTHMVAPWPFRVVPWSLLGAQMACLVAGVLAGWVPAQRAAQLPPAACLRGD